MQLYTHVAQHVTDDDIIESLCDSRIYATSLEDYQASARPAAANNYCVIDIDDSFIADSKCLQFLCHSLLKAKKQCTSQLAFYRALQSTIIENSTEIRSVFKDAEIDEIFIRFQYETTRAELNESEEMPGAIISVLEQTLYKCGYCGYSLAILDDVKYKNKVRLFSSYAVSRIERYEKSLDSSLHRCIFKCQ